MFPNDDLVLNEFKKAIRKNEQTPVINLDQTFTHKFDFEIQRLEDVRKTAGPTIPPNKWSYYRIGLLKKGSIEFLMGIHKFKAVKNTLAIWPLRITTSSKNWSPDIEGYVVLFNMDFFLQNNFPHKYIEDKKILNTGIQPHIQVSDEKAAALANIFETMIKEKNSRHKNKQAFMALKVIELLILSERLFEEELHLQDDLPSLDIVKKFVDLLEENFLYERSVGFYAAKLNIHPNYLNSLIKKHSGLTAKESIQNRLLLETKYLLHSTTLSIKEISNKMGFADPNYFTVFFKRFESTSPMNYRSSFI